MDISTQKRWRTLVPGTLLFIEFLPIYPVLTNGPLISIESLDKTLSLGLGIIAAFALGYAYNAYCLRAFVNAQSHVRITRNIKECLLQIGRTKPLTPEERQGLLAGNKLLDVFYSLLDSNETLKLRQNIVRHNGLAWTSAADVIVIGTVFALLYVPCGIALHSSLLLSWGTISALFATLSDFFFHPRFERIHIGLGNEQLDFIRLELKKEAVEKVDAL